MKGLLGKVGDKVGATRHCRVVGAASAGHGCSLFFFLPFSSFAFPLSAAVSRTPVCRRDEQGQGSQVSLRNGTMRRTLFSRLVSRRDDMEYNELCKQLGSYASSVKDLDARLTKYLQAATVLMGDAEKLAGVSDKISNASALGRATETSNLKPSIAGLKEKVDAAKSDTAALMAELKAMQGHIDERHKLGATMASLQKKASTLEGKNDPKAGVARGEADRAEETYNRKHEDSLDELKAWKDSAGSRYSSLFDEVEAIVQYLFTNS